MQPGRKSEGLRFCYSDGSKHGSEYDNNDSPPWSYRWTSQNTFRDCLPINFRKYHQPFRMERWRRNWRNPKSFANDPQLDYYCDSLSPAVRVTLAILV
jgi:hypothetical protein